MVLQDERGSSVWSDTILPCIECGPSEEFWAEMGLDLRSNLLSRPFFAKLKEKQRERHLLREAPACERHAFLGRKNLRIS